MPSARHLGLSDIADQVRDERSGQRPQIRVQIESEEQRAERERKRRRQRTAGPTAVYGRHKANFGRGKASGMVKKGYHNMGEGGDFGYVEAVEPTPEPPMDVHIDRG